MFIKIENGMPIGNAITEDNLRLLFPQISFPQIFTPAFVQPLGFGMYEWTQIPEVFYPNKLIEISPTLRDNGIYYQTWNSIEMTDEEKIEATINQKQLIRSQRNHKLRESDWTQVDDAPVDKQAWATYRQALRDISGQSGFPWEVQWPEMP